MGLYNLDQIHWKLIFHILRFVKLVWCCSGITEMIMESPKNKLQLRDQRSSKCCSFWKYHQQQRQHRCGDSKPYIVNYSSKLMRVLNWKKWFCIKSGSMIISGSAYGWFFLVTKTRFKIEIKPPKASYITYYIYYVYTKCIPFLPLSGLPVSWLGLVLVFP